MVPQEWAQDGFGEIGQAWLGCKQPFADIADLVLDLSFFPAGCGRAGNRFEQVVVGQRHETRVELALLAGEDLHALCGGIRALVELARVAREQALRLLQQAAKK